MQKITQNFTEEMKLNKKVLQVIYKTIRAFKKEYDPKLLTE